MMMARKALTVGLLDRGPASPRWQALPGATPGKAAGDPAGKQATGGPADAAGAEEEEGRSGQVCATVCV